jgi:hypothetical protein
MFLQISHLGGPSCSWIELVGSFGSEMVASRRENSVKQRASHEPVLRDIPMICVAFRMGSAVRALCALRDVRRWGKMANQGDPRRLSKEVCTSGGRITVHQHRRKVASAPNIRVPGGNILRQRGSVQRQISMPIMPKRSLGPCAANGPPCAARPTGMPQPPRDCRGCYGCTGWCPISCVCI